MKEPLDGQYTDYETGTVGGAAPASTAAAAGYDEKKEVFGDETNAAVCWKSRTLRCISSSGSNAWLTCQIHYRTLSWQLVAVLMIAEIVSNGMLSLPSSLAVVGIVPGTIIIVFLGVFAAFTSRVLIQFKLRLLVGLSCCCLWWVRLVCGGFVG